MKFYLKYTVKNLLLFLSNLLLSPFSREARHKLSAVYLSLQYPFYGSSLVDLSQLLKDDNLELNLAPVKARMHNTDPFELLSVCAVLKDNDAETIFEIGTFDGRTTMSMALNIPAANGHIYTLNLPPQADAVKLATDIIDVQLANKVVSGERFLNTPQQENITQLWGDSASFDFSPYYNSMDFVFIDGAHSEDYVKNDTAIALKLVKKSGGVIMWHDAHLFGVVKFLKPWIKNNNLPVYFIRNTTLAIARVKNEVVVDMFN
jgi:predicted O-methyltransferase YrrM